MRNRWCCKATDHPNDWYCMNIAMHPKCPIYFPPPLPPGAGEGEIQYTSSERLDSLDKALTGTDNGPSMPDLIGLADALMVENYAEDAIRVTRYVGDNAKLSDLTVLTTAFHIEERSFEPLGNLDAAESARQITNHLVSIAQLRSALPAIAVDGHQGGN